MDKLFIICFSIYAIVVTIYVLALFITSVMSFVSKIKKKKMKDKRNKLRVVFIRNDNTHNIPIVKDFYSDNDLSDCVCATLCYAKAYNSRIKSMTVLTTE